eukprot:6840405-Alexandrium_andersonii.AAC.1
MLRPVGRGAACIQWCCVEGALHVRRRGRGSRSGRSPSPLHRVFQQHVSVHAQRLIWGQHRIGLLQVAMSMAQSLCLSVRFGT